MNGKLPVIGSEHISDPRIDWIPTDIYDWEFIETNTLVLNYTLSCPLACDFCCYGCHPNRKEKMPLELALSLVDQAAELGVFSCVAFTGGEPMLHFDELLIIGDKLYSKNIPFTLVTAAHWGIPTQVEKMLDELAKRGLKRLNVSLDPSHAKFVPRNYAINVVKTASNMKIPTYVTGTFYSPTDSLGTYAPEIVDLPYVRLMTKNVAKVGRAINKKIPEIHDDKITLEALRCYRQIYHDIVVFHDGKTYPCCSTFNRATDGIELGNALHDSLEELWRRAEGSLLLRAMKRHGFAKVYKIIEELDQELFKQLPSTDGMINTCVLCNKIFSNEKLTERIKVVFDRYEQQKVSETIDFISKLIGEDETMNLVKEILK